MHYLSLHLRFLPKGYQFPKAEPGKFFYDELEYIDEAALIVYRPSDDTMLLPQETEWEQSCLSPDLTILEDLFVLEGISTVYDHLIVSSMKSINTEWLIEGMQGNNYADFEHNLKAIAEDVRKLIAEVIPTSESRPQQELVKSTLHYLREEEKSKPLEIQILTQWSVETSIDWESQVEEVDSFTYQGRAVINSIRT